MATIDDFLSTGRLGDVGIGQSPDEVRAVLGEPEDVSTRKKPLVWKYGPLELTFWRESPETEAFLVTVGLYFHSDGQDFPQSLGLEGWVPTGETTLSEFLDHLQTAGLRVQEHHEAAPEDHLVLESDARTTFDEGRLYCIHAYDRRETETRQLSVSVSPQQLEVIRGLAKSRGISMYSLCSEWVREHTDQAVATT